MGLSWSWSTFVVEIVNFVVLVWLLKRFLYQPVMAAIARRQRAIEDELRRAEDLKHQGEEIAVQYRSRLTDWEGQKAELKAAFERELGAQRTEREAALQADLQKAQEQSEAAARAREFQRERQMERQAAGEGARFCAHLLTRVASPDLEGRLVDAALADLAALSEDDRARLARSADGRDDAAVVTRYPLDEGRRLAVAATLAHALRRELRLRFEQSDDLVAGVRVDLGTTALEGNLGAELRWFSQTFTLAEGSAAR